MEAEVLGTDSDGDVKVSVNGRKWIFNPEACSLLSRRSENSDDDDDDDDNDTNDNDDTDEVSSMGLKTEPPSKYAQDRHWPDSLCSVCNYSGNTCTSCIISWCPAPGSRFPLIFLNSGLPSIISTKVFPYTFLPADFDLLLVWVFLTEYDAELAYALISCFCPKK